MHAQVLAITFSDVFKSGFLENFTDFSITDYLLALGASFLIGLFIFFIYTKSFSGVMYSFSFNASLVLMTMITSLIILGITSNVVLSLGMVGALSIVRFRSAIKDPIDIVFIFWAICEGILCGAMLFPLALIGAAVIGALIMVFSIKKDISEPYLLIVRFTNQNDKKRIQNIVKNEVKRYRVKSVSTLPEETELIVVARLRKGNKDFLQSISKIDSVTYASLVNYTGNYYT